MRSDPIRNDTIRNTSRKHASIFSFSIITQQNRGSVWLCVWVTRESHGGNSWHDIELNPFLQLVFFLVLPFVFSFESFDSLRGWPVFITTSHCNTPYSVHFFHLESTSIIERQKNTKPKDSEHCNGKSVLLYRNVFCLILKCFGGYNIMDYIWMTFVFLLSFLFYLPPMNPFRPNNEKEPR